MVEVNSRVNEALSYQSKYCYPGTKTRSWDYSRSNSCYYRISYSWSRVQMDTGIHREAVAR